MNHVTNFFAPPEAFRHGSVHLPREEAHHAVRVLRHRPGDEIVVVDGIGGWHRVRVDAAAPDALQGTVLETRREVGEPSYRLTLAMGVVKQPARFELVVEKAVELGVTALLPFASERTERARLKADRMQGLMLAATKQCGRSRVPALAPVQSLADVLRLEAPLRLLCHEQAPSESLPARLAASPVRELVVLVGPEGGFSPAEAAAAQRLGWQLAGLGPRRLRAETAALAALAAVLFHFETHPHVL